MQIIIKGELTDIFPAEIFGNFEKRVAWVLEKDVQYPNHYQIEFHQGDANMLDNFLRGDIVECKVDVRGKKFKSKQGKDGIINTLKCWNIIKVGGAKPAPSTRQQTGGIPPQNQAPAQGNQDQWKQPPPIEGAGDDDLPF